ncbi:MAG TPA: hypothetical protein VJC17_04355 [Candidatus Dojkabacteria bacterium]|nr:hypothetical protein [Candidatus Dojkabacteria bacterium]
MTEETLTSIPVEEVPPNSVVRLVQSAHYCQVILNPTGVLEPSGEWDLSAGTLLLTHVIPQFHRGAGDTLILDQWQVQTLSVKGFEPQIFFFTDFGSLTYLVLKAGTSVQLLEGPAYHSRIARDPDSRFCVKVERFDDSGYVNSFIQLPFRVDDV